MPKIGLKLWSNNVDNFLQDAVKLFSNDIFDFIELYIVPETIHTIPHWNASKIPIQVHCTHSNYGFNLSNDKLRANNFNLYLQAKKFTDSFEANSIVFHGGIGGTINETIYQLNKISDKRALVENKPYKPLNYSGKVCIGASIEEIKQIIKETNCGFCLDICHAICAANSFKINPYDYIEKFMELSPKQIHLSDTDISSEFDQHLNYGKGNVCIERILPLIGSLPIVIETQKDPTLHLNDFAKDVNYIKSFFNC